MALNVQQLQKPVCALWYVLFFLPHFNGDLHFKATVHPKPIFNSTLCRFSPRWDFSNPCNHRGVSQTEPTRLTHSRHNGSLVLEGKQKQRRRDASPHRSRFCPHVFTSICHNTVFVLFCYVHCSLRAKIPPSCISLVFPHGPELA